ncbi:hypothetical protein HKBW3S03_00608 [Candidatus Hakubella thermalkaliphila]|uniref:Uncharacterized protein n=2 Tax=Candidatus Hakubella thermalkaliphila TaxID=2754717 RepID=A0A6V8NI99_9ACTN|nr:hypothetical protein [Candidatus Hakubella thermalkaliphila]GFP19104.1 hypothetical protein HKBW3S03_00608 [Candidatus Hakubella thermalkaliphila]GFP24896.1 hypothetical protein HKBW3S25_00334 [Candidatus Hakubella thermalkaliphila]GFP27425.1 hypothetical protein HKBW3S33_00838 [Candidatus Hakubella thermalkaliphila]GFP29566.1 hypothetical protein HKBW3S34_00486 [Candidatus Hakubella thermalkaliphila]GFP34213.1 hypothetical protein HKBW3S43_00004 [Candidatus Hakubella thermalkaliphila]
MNVATIIMAVLAVALIGPKVTLVRVLSTLIFPPIAGIIAQTFFGKFA